MGRTRQTRLNHTADPETAGNAAGSLLALFLDKLSVPIMTGDVEIRRST
jgi:hypothetical protein